MNDEELENFQPDFTVDQQLICPQGGGHYFIEIDHTVEKQVLKCTRCGIESIGYYN